MGGKCFSLDGRGTACGNFFDFDLWPKTGNFLTVAKEKLFLQYPPPKKTL